MASPVERGYVGRIQMSHVDEAYLPGHFSPASQHGEELAQTKSQRLCDMNKIDIRVHIASKLQHTFIL